MRNLLAVYEVCSLCDPLLHKFKNDIGSTFDIM